MKLSPRDATAWIRKPDPGATGLLIYGNDAMRVALRRQEVIAALIGPAGEAEMRLTRMPAADLRKEPARLIDALGEVGFFPGPRVVFVEDAGDAQAPAIAAALEDWREGDAMLVVTASSLRAASPLRKAFEAHRTAFALALYDDPPDAEEIARMLEAAGLTAVAPDARASLGALARQLDPGDFRQTVEKLGLYKIGDATPVGLDDIGACAPVSAEAEMDDLLAIVAEGRVKEIAPILQRLYAQGAQPVGLSIGATRHFRALHAAASDPGGAGAGLGRLRPPVFGPRRDAMARQIGAWGRDRLERALSLLIETDLQLRSSHPAPQPALMERALIRLAMMAAQRSQT